MGSTAEHSGVGPDKAVPVLDVDGTAFFFDFDGVLADIVDDPSAVTVEPGVLQNLAALSKATGGAVALISGREISQLDAFVSPHSFPVAGAHGAERRIADGKIVREEIDAVVLQRLADAVSRFASGHDGVIVEIKETGVTLHYRRRPELASQCIYLAERLAAENEDVRLLRGKMVAELKLTDRNKGHAIESFMAEEPFDGRRPVFVGDDVTDEDGFAVVQAMGGIGIKIGAGDTSAAVRLNDIEAFRAWLGRVVDGSERRRREEKSA